MRFLTRLASADVSSILRYNIFFCLWLFERLTRSARLGAVALCSLPEIRLRPRLFVFFIGFFFCVRISLCVGNTIALWRSVLKSNQSCRRG